MSPAAACSQLSNATTSQMGNRFSRKKKAATTITTTTTPTPTPTPTSTQSTHQKYPSSEFESLSGDFANVRVPRRLSVVPGRDNKISIDDFIVLSVLGRGSFGKVCLVKKLDDSRLFALKALNKEALLRRNQVAHTKTERMILSDVHHSFLVQLEYAFQSDTRLYLVLEFMSGGEMYYWLRRAKRFAVNRAKLYAAEVMLALEFLHTKDIVYRDLKPENILLDKAGHVKLTDFGLSKEGITGQGPENGTDTFCGTPEYLAPEILANKGHGKSVDWWSLGVLVCEMLTGDPPFYNENTQAMYRLILHSEPKYTRPLKKDAMTLLSGLLERKIEKRLTSSEIRNSNFFGNTFQKNGRTVVPLDWDKVLRKEYAPVFGPPVFNLELNKLNIDPYYTKKSTKETVRCFVCFVCCLIERKEKKISPFDLPMSNQK